MEQAAELAAAEGVEGGAVRVQDAPDLHDLHAVVRWARALHLRGGRGRQRNGNGAVRRPPRQGTSRPVWRSAAFCTAKSSRAPAASAESAESGRSA